MSKSILEEAQQIVNGDREKDYGPVNRNFTRIAMMWCAISDATITPDMVGLMMVALKIARQCHKPKRDNLVDGAGYFATIEKMHNEQQETDAARPGISDGAS